MNLKKPLLAKENKYLTLVLALIGLFSVETVIVTWFGIFFLDWTFTIG